MGFSEGQTVSILKPNTCSYHSDCPFQIGNIGSNVHQSGSHPHPPPCNNIRMYVPFTLFIQHNIRKSRRQIGLFSLPIEEETISIFVRKNLYIPKSF